MAEERPKNTVILADARAVRESSDKQIAQYLANYDKVYMPSYHGAVTDEQLQTLIPEGQRGTWGPRVTGNNPTHIEKRRQLVALHRALNGAFGTDRLTMMGVDEDVQTMVGSILAHQERLGQIGISRHMETATDKRPGVVRDDMVEQLAKDGLVDRGENYYKDVKSSNVIDSFDPTRSRDYEGELEEEIVANKLEREFSGDNLEKAQLGMRALGSDNSAILKGEQSLRDVATGAISHTREKQADKTWKADIDKQKKAQMKVEEQRKGFMGKLKAAFSSGKPKVETISDDEYQEPVGRSRGRGVDTGRPPSPAKKDRGSDIGGV